MSEWCPRCGKYVEFKALIDTHDHGLIIDHRTTEGLEKKHGVKRMVEQTCGNCAYYARCNDLIFTIDKDDTCDWEPSRWKDKNEFHPCKCGNKKGMERQWVCERCGEREVIE